MLVGLGLAGCNSQPQVTGVNREILVSLTSAVSAQDTEWLEKNAKLIEAKKADGSLTEAQAKVLDGIVKTAREGRWKEAAEAVYALLDGQEPTAEDRQNAETRKMDHDDMGRTLNKDRWKKR